MEPKLESLVLDDAECAKAWLVSFEALCRAKQIEDKLSTIGTSAVTDAFLARCGGKPLLKIMSLVSDKDIERMLFKDIKQVIENYLAPRKRLVIADRTNFLQLHQKDGEPVVDYLSRLNEASVFCKWDELKQGNPTEELIKLRFIAGLKDPGLKIKILEKMQLSPKLDIHSIVDFCQMDAQVTNFADEAKAATGTSNSEVLYLNSKKCGRCGNSHKPRHCPAFGKTCAKCGKAGHFAAVCKSQKAPSQASSGQTKKSNRQNYKKPYQSHNVDLFTITANTDGIMKEVFINEKPLKFQVDTGAGMSILSQNQWKSIGSPDLCETNLQPTNYDGSKIETLGEINLKVCCDNSSALVKFIVVTAEKPYGLLGRNIIDKEKSYIETFVCDTEFLPTIKGYCASLALIDPNKPLKFFKARPVPMHYKEQIIAELESLEKQGIITPLNFSSHASPVVWVKKSNGRFRMCVDFKATLNSNIKSDAYPLPTVEEVFARVGNASKFAKVDLKSAYSQIELDDEAKKSSVINTIKGLYTVNRLQMGMKNSSAIFQRCIEHIIKGLNGVIAYQDDVLVCAESSTQLHKRLGQLKKRLKDYNVTINESKSVEESDSLTFLGFTFSRAGIKPDQTLVTKIVEMPTPTSAKELSSFLGLANYYGRFIKNFAEITVPLHNLKKNADTNYQWNDECEKSFQQLKQALVGEPVLKPFSLQKQSVLTVDASMSAIGAVLSQDEHPVIFISRKLTSTESRYSNIEREGLAVIWACNRLVNFLLGKQFIIETDHKPLTWIFGPSNPVKMNISARLLKYSLSLMRFDYTIKHIEGSKNVIADTLSRIDHRDNTLVPCVHFVEPCISMSELKCETERDHFLSNLKKRIISGNWRNLSKWEKCFLPHMKSLTIDENDVIRLGTKVVPPRSLYESILRVAHQSHSGVNSTASLIQMEFFWPYMSRIIKTHVQNCATCSNARFSGSDTTHKWKEESAPWSRLHIDWAYSQRCGEVLIVVDSYSGWLEAVMCNNRSTDTVIKVLRSIFARFGVPFTLVSDNAPEFTSQQFHQWLSSIGCKVIHSPEYHPQSNGLAERMVRVLKDGIKCFDPSKCTVDAFIQRLLFVHRNTSTSKGQTPAEILTGRKVRCPILSEYQLMQELLYKPHRKANPTPVRFLFRQGMNTSVIAHPNNRTVLAHDAQLTAAPNSDVHPSTSETEGRPVRNRAPPQFYGTRYFM